MAELVGEQIGNYRVISQLARGGMGAVYVAEHPEIGRRVAIKVMHTPLDGDSVDAKRFLFEARAAASISHPNVIDIYDFGRLADGRPYHVMELLQGHVLGVEMGRLGKMSAAQVLPYVQQICAALQAAHNLGIVHRDLKPENIFVLAGPGPALKVLDFGIAKSNTWSDSTLTSKGNIVGTPLVIAPEQAASDNSEITCRADLYSLGVIIYWMLAGEPPFAQDAPAVLLARHILTPPRPLAQVEPSVSAEVADLVDRCLEKEPELRPESARQLAQGLALAVDQPLDPRIPEAIPWEEVERQAPMGATLDSDHQQGEGPAPRTSGKTDLDVPGLELEFDATAVHSTPDPRPAKAQADPRPGEPTAGSKRWLVVLLLLGLGAAAALALFAWPAPRPASAPDSGPAAPDSRPADTAAPAAPDHAVAATPDHGPTPDRAAPPPRHPPGSKRPGSKKPGTRRPRKPDQGLPWCREGKRMGESTMDPFGTRCRKK